SVVADANGLAGRATASRATRAPSLVGRQIGEIGTVAFTRVEDVEVLLPEPQEELLDGTDDGAGHRNVVAEEIDVAALAAEIRLHVDHDESRVFREKLAVIGPRIRICRNEPH